MNKHTELTQEQAAVLADLNTRGQFFCVVKNGESGKSECWYVLDCKPGSEIILGHNAKSKEEFLQLVREQRWDDLLVRLPVKAGDFFYIPCGAVHALGYLPRGRFF